MNGSGNPVSKSTEINQATEENLMAFDTTNTALVITDPQNDFLSPDGVTWGMVGESVVENNTSAKH